jgi:hypothetical protein
MSTLTVNVVPADRGERLVAGPVVHRVLEEGSSTGGRLACSKAAIRPGGPGRRRRAPRARGNLLCVLGGAVGFISGAAARPSSTSTTRPGNPLW